MAATPLRPDTRRFRLLAMVLALSIAIGAVGLAAYVGDWFDEESADAEPTTTVPPPTSTSTTVAPSVPVATTLVQVALPGGDMPTFDGPNGTQIGTAGHWYGYEQTMPVIAEQPGWYQIRLPERPNGLTAWVRASDVVTSTTPYRVVLSLNRTRVTVYKDGYFAFDMPGGFGKASTPTPRGNYYVAVVERDVPGYGPVVLDLSAHSEAIQSWQGSGDAIIALHGPFGSSSRIGTIGTYLSNGCIRLHTEDQLKLAVIP
ncbi:MAG: L,D-transpeptidase, partial [Acidimicrobiales bacterium]|nr:L,D-transpeptidase [Acidimicrobiales bacterium]